MLRVRARCSNVSAGERAGAVQYTNGRSAATQSMIPKKPAPDVIRGGYRFSEKIMLQQ
jgi:hypothetical protein